MQYTSELKMDKNVSLAKEPQKVDAHTPKPSQKPIAPAGRKYCPNCRIDNQDDAIFCKKCGKKIPEE